MVKLTIGDFTVELLGVEYPDHFQGYGLGPNSEYTDCGYGVGDTEAGAFDDCMEMLADSGLIDFDAEVEKRIRDEYGSVDDSITAADELGITEESDIPLCGPDSTFDEFPAYFHVGISWNVKQATRLNRVRAIENVQPLRYEDYRPWRDSDGMVIGWGYARRIDGNGSYGDFKDTDWPASVEDYVSSLCDDIEETGELYFYAPQASGSDYSGSTVGMANYKCLQDTYGDNKWVHDVVGGYRTYALAIGLSGLLGCDDDTFDEFCETLENLADYPVIDDESLCEVETEGADEGWETWAQSEFTDLLEKEFEDNDFDFSADSEFRALFDEMADSANEYWFNDGPGSDMYIDIAKIVGGVDFDDVSKWAIQYKVSYTAIGNESETYYVEWKAIERVKDLREVGYLGAHYETVGTEKVAA